MSRIIGLTGMPLAGKDSIAHYLVERHGFTYISLSDMLRDYITEHGLGPTSREVEHRVGNQLREKHGAEYLMRRALGSDAEKLVTGSVRTMGETKLLKQQGGELWCVTASDDLRYQRALARKRPGDEVSRDQFVGIETKEMRNPNPKAQNMSAVMAAADRTVENNGNLSALQRTVDGWLS